MTIRFSPLRTHRPDAAAYAFWVVLLSSAAWGAEPTAAELLKGYDDLMGPTSYEAEAQMTATREDGSTRTYTMRFLKRDADKFRVSFKEPPEVRGQEILRQGDNAWLYLPNLKRSMRMPNRENFQGGDFNNADVLRVNYVADYTVTLVSSDLPEAYCLDLKAKHGETAYDAIKLYLRKSDRQPVKGLYFGTSGKLLRSAAFTDHKEFSKGYIRPARVVMRNEVVPSRKSELAMRAMRLGVEIPPQRFTQADLGK